MNTFIVVIFPDEAKAYDGVRALNTMHDECSVTVYSVAVIQRDGQGRVSVKQQQEQGPNGVGVGMLVGGLIGLLGGPAGVALGASSGGLIGALRDVMNLGVSNDFLEVVSREPAPGKTAIVAEVSEEWVTPLDSRMEAIGGTVIREVRADFIEEHIERRIDDRRAEVKQLRAEHARASAEAAAKLKQKVDKAEQKLRDTVEQARERLEHYTDEADAKIKTLQGQARKATADAKSRIEERIAEMRADKDQRIGKLKQAWKLTQEALRP